jgi:phage shock protein PspC (stress-responsive transcriptional regulator)
LRCTLFPVDDVGVASTALVRPRQGRLIGGVCAALARRFGMSPTGVRVLFVLSMLLPGPQILLYVVLWLVIPSER